MDRPEGNQNRSLGSRLLSATGRSLVTLAFTAAAIGIGLAGYDALAARTSGDVGPDPAPLTSVVPDVLRIVREISIERRFTGQFEAARDVALGFEESGTIAEIFVREGDRVSRGDVIARLDTRILEAEKSRLSAAKQALEAQAELARRTNDRQSALLTEGHVTQQRVDETSLQLAQLQARLAETEAGLAIVAVRLAKSEIRAPFDGRIGTRDLDEGAIAGAGRVVATLLEDAPPRFRVALDPKLAARLAAGSTVSIEVDGRMMPAVLQELAPELDPATRSQLAYFQLPDGTEAPPARTAGDVVLADIEQETGAWVPISAMRQGPRGAWTLLTLDLTDEQAASVGIEAVELLRIESERAFVRGSFVDGTLFLPTGTHRVVPGEQVLVAKAGA